LTDLLQSSLRNQDTLEQLATEGRAASASLSSLPHQLRSERRHVLQLNHKPPPKISDQLIALTFDARMTKFVGREDERNRATEFLNDAAPVLWWQIAGPGGEGKSRFALDILDGLDPARYGGFLSGEDLRQTNWSEIEFPEPTLIVVDYLAVPEKAEAFARMIRALHGRAEGASGPHGKPFTSKIRVLALEREGYEFEPTGESRGTYNWLSAALLNPNLRTPLRTRVFCASAPLLLPELSANDMGRVLQSFRESRGKSALPPAALERLLGLLGARSSDGRKTRAWRPLFAMIAGEVALADGSLGADGGSVEDLLEAALATEREQFWPNHGNLTEGALNLALIATMVGRIPSERFLETVAPNHEDRDAAATFYGLKEDPVETLRQAWCALGRNVAPAPGAERTPDLEARTPDLMGEGLVLHYLRGAVRGGLQQPNGQQRIGKLAADAWRLAPAGFLEFMFRMHEDFPRHIVTRVIADAPAPTDVLAGLGSLPIVLLAGLGMRSALAQEIEAAHAEGRVQPAEIATALVVAAQEGHADCVRALLDNNAAPDQTNAQNGTFPLLQAAQNGHADCVRALLERDAERNQRHPSFGTARDLATAAGLNEIVALLDA
jgi:hypothetical protein